MQKGPTTPKGFRDLDPEIAKLKSEIISKISEVLEEFDFSPIETPTVEFAETLLGKYGEEEKLIYTFSDRGGRELALRYDLTVPLARYVANNLGALSPTFSRYQIGQVFRGENPQAGRYREFTQFDMDVVGSDSSIEDARVIAAAIKAARRINLKNAMMAVNDRENFKSVPVDFVRAIDKLHKVGREGVAKELEEKGYSNTEIEKIDVIKTADPTDNLKLIFEQLEKEYGLKEDKDYFFDPTLARGLDYYTGAIYELKPNGKAEEQSAGAGGRYDKLIGMFAGKTIPAVGFSFGLDRIIALKNS